MTMTRAPRGTAPRGCARYEPKRRNIYLAEVDQLCDLLQEEGHNRLAQRVRAAVEKHVHDRSMKPGAYAPTVAPFEPLPTERRPLTAALAEIRNAWSCA